MCIRDRFSENGTLLWYGHALKIAYSQIILDKYFELLNSAVWEKTAAQREKSDYRIMRRFGAVTERLLIYHNGNNVCGMDRFYDDNSLFVPIKKYLDDWLTKSCVSYRDIKKSWFDL